MSTWTEHRNAADGRLYWYNPATQASVWDVSSLYDSISHYKIADTYYCYRNPKS